MKPIITKILKLKPITLGLVFLLLPFISAIFTAIIEIISIFANFEVFFTLFQISITIILLIYFFWVWGVVNHTEEKEVTNKIYFKISYWIFFSYCLILFIHSIELDIFKKGFILENRTWEIIGYLAEFYAFIVFISYTYISYFIGKKIGTLENNSSNYTFFYVTAAWVFPIGVPFLLQPKLQNKNSFFDKILNK